MTTSDKKIITNPVAQILRQLLHEAGIKESELARQVNLPQTTINRLLLGGTLDPRANTLKPIADFFGVTIGQLCGFEPLSSARIAGTMRLTNKQAWRFIPLIEWQQISSWVFTQHSLTPLNHKNWISTERMVSDNAFAIRSLASMEPRFRKGSVLIVDPDADYHDGHHVIVALDGITPTVRRIIIDGADVYLKAFDSQQALSKLSQSQKIYGTIVESRLDIYND